MLQRKVIVAIADGIGDRPHPLIGNKTPLEYAHTPNLDDLAAKGITGMMNLISPGIPVGTDMGHLILFGYQPEQYPGRGPIEALGVGMDVKPGDVVLRCNFATVNEEGIVLDRRAQRIREKTDEIAAAIQEIKLADDVEVHFKQATEHRAVLILRGNGLSDKVSDSDPKAPNDGKPYLSIKPLDDSSEAAYTAFLLNLFLEKAHAMLSDHPVNLQRIAEGKLPANFILTRGAGQMVDLRPITEQLGMTGSCIAGESTVLGVASLAGFQTFSDPAMTGNIDTDIALKASLAIQEIQEKDMVYVHVKAPDLMGHDNQPIEKAKSIELFDQMVGMIAQQLPDDVYLALAADHSTPCEVGEHTGDPVPVLIYGPSIRKDRIMQYNELDCAHGGLGHLSGSDFVRTLHGFMGLVKKQGN
ncbi:phosphoglycerate mutase [Brevibacillus reuszeri]|uniref:Phosphoglycerate mutase n=1 Tax=Brevibacillus reuszeri TaxID=54915 RepID=A0A0K9YQT6_9BACL|nr:2,3-bisphosphoglycerate-independent phosphoglycerate mutase [Brevibacillus reuszeri]KNB71002.1 phosphoglycerate mutase [Brevibacillus reuszeri]MED1857420.1 2,3-bisphosphoglycerate-independent phosphoglycerate mutase [Brevibacillus reuszeri]GED66750.1 phosphoglycerate mutase [Brevibacillus reuszeri]